MLHKLSLLTAACVLAVAAPVSAATISAGGGGAIIAAPSILVNANVANTQIEAFDEAQDVFLTDALSVDGGTVAAGLTVDSHMIFLNAANGTPGLDFGLSGTDPVTFTFDGDILGVMSDSFGALEVASTPLLGAAGTVYPAAGFNARGMETNDVANKNNDWYTFSGNTISLGMRVTQPGDWIRVVTQSPAPVPVPAAGLLLPAALGALALTRRRRRKAA